MAGGRTEDVFNTGKNGRTRTIHFLDYARVAIRAYLSERTDSNPALFVSHSRRADGKRLTTWSVQRMVETIVCQNSGGKIVKILSGLLRRGYS
ncbi:MAG: hypothetical protein GY796_05955 [Chloroflexi bacterium]|nr:hypothetical protein [Chloroflexota bacterium]